MKIFIETEHDNSQDWHSWALTGDTTRRAKDGSRRGATTRFFETRCDNPQCPALALVLGTDLEELIAAELQPVSA